MSQNRRRGLDLQGSHQPERNWAPETSLGQGSGRSTTGRCPTGDGTADLGGGMQKPRPIAYGQHLGTLSKGREDSLHKNQFYDRSSSFFNTYYAEKR